MNRSDPVLESSRREALFTVGVWISACVYTVGYAWAFAYRPEQGGPVLGMPGWVFWGIVTPWLVCTLVTCWFALRGMRDEELEPMDGAVEAGGEGHG